MYKQKIKKWWKWMGLTVIWTLSIYPQLSPAREEQVLNIESRQLEVDDQTHQALFKGDVKAQWGEWMLQCQSLEVKYLQKGEISKAICRGPIFLSGPEGLLEGRKAIYHNDSIDIPGPMIWRKGKSFLKGRDAHVDLKSRKVTLQEVKGRWIPNP